MNLYDQIKLPAIIIGSPRSGTTVLTHDIADYYRSQGVSIDAVDTIPENDIIHAINTETKCVLKIHPFNLISNNLLYQCLLSGKSYLIKLTRLDTVSQMTSNYIELVRERYLYVNPLWPTGHDPITIDNEKIKSTVDIIWKQNLLLSTLPIKFDMELIYEDLVFPYTELVKTPRPANYDEVKQLIEEYFMQVKDQGIK